MAASSKKTETTDNTVADKPQQPANKHIVFIQLNRLGDLIQTAIAADALKRSRPEIKLSLIGRASFVRPLQFLLDSVFDHVFEVNLPQLVGQANKGLAPVLGDIKEFLAKIDAHPINVLINLSLCKTSNYLSSALKTKYRLGSYYTLQGDVACKDHWGQYMMSTVMSSSLNPFNLVDIYRSMIGTKDIDVFVPKRKVSSTQDAIFIHPFASNERKRWKPAKWAEVIYKVLKENPALKVYLVGAPAEAAAAEQILQTPTLAQFGARIQSLTGKLSLKDLSAKMSREAKLFIGHDSAIGHLASFYAITTITVSLGNSRPHEIIPYGDKNLILSPTTKCFPCFPDEACPSFECHSSISFHAVASVVKYALTGYQKETLKSREMILALGSARLYQSCFNNDFQLELKNLSDDYSDVHNSYLSFYQIVWSFFYNSIELQQGYPKITPQTLQTLESDVGAIQNLYELCTFGMKYCGHILKEIASSSPSIKELKVISKKIDEIDQLVGTIGRTYPNLSPVTNMLKIQKSNLDGVNLVEMSESSYHVYQRVSQVSSILYELIGKTTDNYKITSKKLVGKDAPKSV